MENKTKVWIARDKDNRLFAYSYIPNKEKDIWKLEGNSVCMELSFREFPSVKWEDDEPTEAYITLAEPQEQPKQEKAIDWEQRRYEIAKEMLPVIYRQGVAALKYWQSIKWEDTVNGAVNFADMLISKLKNENK